MFVNLHNHTHYSLLDGMARPLEYVLKAREHGSPGIAITDHGNLHGVIELYQYAKKNDINPILGCEVYMTPGSRFERTNVTDNKRYFHLILLAKNNTGYENLLQLVTHSYLEGMYYKPRIDWELLERYGKGLIALSACLGSELSNAIINGSDEEEAHLVIKKHQQVFGSENYFLEVQPHTLPDQVRLNNKLFELSNSLNVPIVATSDAHYVNREDQEAQEIMLCIQTNAQLSDENRFTMKDADCSLKSPEYMQTFFADHLDALSNTLYINESCKVDIKLGKNLIPTFEVPQPPIITDSQDESEKEISPTHKAGEDSPTQPEQERITPQQFLREICYAGLQRRYPFQLSEEDIHTLIEIPDYVLEENEKLEEITGEKFKGRFENWCGKEQKKD